MFSGKLGRRTLTSWIAGAILALAVPALAQTGRIQGKVVDDKDAAVQGAQILVTAIPDQGGQKWQANSDKNGNYIIGTLPKSGQYLVVAIERGRRRGRSARRGEDRQLHDDELQALARARASARSRRKKNAEIKKFFEAGVAAAQAGNHQAAVDAFTNAGVAMPTCADCYFNVGVSQQQLKNSARRRSGVQEGDRAAPELPRGLQRACGALHAGQEDGPRGGGLGEGGRARASRPAAAATPTRSTAPASACGTRTSSPKRARRSKRRSRPTRTTPTRTSCSAR